MSTHARLSLLFTVAGLAALGLIAANAALSHPATGAHRPGANMPAAGDAQRLPPETRELLREVRKAVRPYREVAAAQAAGYIPAAECVDDPKYGGMGVHFTDPALASDPTLDPLRPEVLVYQPRRDGTLRLGAVEYFRPDADQDLATDGDRPFLFGLPFDGPMLGHEPGMPIHYDLHVWLYRTNPAGLFAMWNPTVRCGQRSAQSAPAARAIGRVLWRHEARGAEADPQSEPGWRE
jgi:hypothetical protein